MILFFIFNINITFLSLLLQEFYLSLPLQEFFYIHMNFVYKDAILVDKSGELLENTDVLL